jgi:hypothetical protein
MEDLKRLNLAAFPELLSAGSVAPITSAKEAEDSHEIFGIK